MIKIKKEYKHKFNIEKAGLVAIFVSASCKNKKQIDSNTDEDLIVKINQGYFREIPPRKNIQLYNIPPAFNGSELKGNKKTVVFLTVLEKGENDIILYPKNGAYIHEIKMQELQGQQNVEFNFYDQGVDANNTPWYTFVLCDLPLKKLSIEASLEKRFYDSDDLKIIIDGDIKKNNSTGKYKFWYLIGGLLTRLFFSRRESIEFEENIDIGTHYIEIWRDRMPILHNVKLELSYTETDPEKRAAKLVENYANVIKDTGKSFEIDPAMIAAVIYQEQSTNVNFIDTLSDYVGGILGINTSIGLGQVRVTIAKALEKHYPDLNPFSKDDNFGYSNLVRVERIKDPLTNIRYVTAKLDFSLKRWSEAGFPIDDRADVIGTLYNIEGVEDPIKPHANPEPNDFGIGVKKNYNKVKKILGL